MQTYYTEDEQYADYSEQSSHSKYACAVCGQPSNGYHFRVQSCRACASFFRRSVAEKRAYECRRNNNCEVKGRMRNVCRACRFRTCVECGMQKDDVTNEVNSDSPPNGTYQTITTIIAPPVDPTLPFEVKYPTLHRLINGYEIFLNAQKTILNAKYGDEIRDGKMKLITKKEQLNIERACLHLLYNMFDGYYDPIKSLVQQHKLTLIETFWRQSGIIHRSYLTSLQYPELDDTRMVMFPSLYMDKNRMNEYLATDVPQNHMEDYIKLRAPIMDRIFRVVRKVKELKLSVGDTVTLICTSLWSDAERLNLTNPEISAHQKTVMNEWSSSLQEVFGPIETSVRIAKLMCLLVDMNHITNALKEERMLTRIFCPCVGDDEYLDGEDDEEAHHCTRY
ncbi:unnamed protein product [Bursaphelenchus okinawaensis]|uniref:Nuclear receptor domain-containing protein n=1 Tax=Bursaphelenchus okinawaensis TaxID=465554 RepID=A0A811L669_9BILA|nr:unnamed protein product [Bursaphelenchus okinawaensis]CAG9116639.1 unnamed protein product [Bursaphelenchus okinawaensis]